MTVTNKRLVEILTTAMEKPEIANALIQRVINTLNKQGQETIAKWIKANTEHREWYICPKCSHQTPRFKDEWQGLTDEEILECTVAAERDYAKHMTATRGQQLSQRDQLDWWIASAIEAKLKEKNT